MVVLGVVNTLSVTGDPQDQGETVEVTEYPEEIDEVTIAEYNQMEMGMALC
jgi:hypothetical protein